MLRRNVRQLLMFGNKSVKKIGGIAIGTHGTGVYNTYKLAGGDDFTGPLNIFTPLHPLGEYGVTGIYSQGSRSKSGILSQALDTDPDFTGCQDINQGVPLVPDTMIQSQSILTLKARTALSGELSGINGRAIVSSMIHTAAAWVFGAPAIYEAYCSFNLASPPSGFHQTSWTINSWPVDQSGGNASPGKIEIDFPEGGAANFNAHGSSPASSGGINLSGIFGNGFHMFTQKLEEAGINYLLDGSSVQIISQDATNTLKPFYGLLTNHVTSPSLSAWASAGTNGFTMSCDYIRVWIPIGSPTINKLQDMPDVFVNYGSAVTYTAPAVTSLYANAIALGVTDYIQAMRMEDFEPGAIGEDATLYLQLPSWATLTGRVITGTPDNPGCLNIISHAWIAGGFMAQVPRGRIYVGPKITTANLSATVGAPFSHNLYPEGYCGTLFPGKKMTCTGLPNWAKFNPVTFLITGTPLSTSSNTITIGVTNSVGQTASITVTLTAVLGQGVGTITGATTLLAQSGSIGSIIGASNVSGVSLTSGNNLAQDGFVSSSTFVSLTIPVTLSTTNTNDIIVVMCYGTTAVTGIADTAGLTWAQYASNTSQANFEGSIWWAYSSGALTSDVITATFSSGFSGGRLVAFGVSGVSSPNYSAPWDTNTSLPAIKNNATSTSSASVTISTTATNTMLLSMIRVNGTTGTVTRPSGFVSLGSAGADEDVAYNIVSSPISSAAQNFSWTGTANQNFLILGAIRQ